MQVGVGGQFGQVVLDLIDIEDAAVQMLALAGDTVDQLAVDVFRGDRKTQYEAHVVIPLI